MQTQIQELTGNQKEPHEFLNWLSSRLRFRFKEDEAIVGDLDKILLNYKLIPKKIPIELIDNICKKHYPDFELEKVPDLNMGYTEQERMQIRNFVIDVIKLTTQQL